MDGDSQMLMDAGRIGFRLTENIRHQNETIQKLNREIAALVSKLNECYSLESKLKISIEKQAKEITELKQKGSALSESEEKLRMENEQLQQALRLAKGEADGASSQLASLEKAQSKRFKRYLAEKEAMEKEHVTLRTYVSRLESEVEIARSNAAELVELKKVDDRIVDEQRAELTSLKMNCLKFEEQLSNAVELLHRNESKHLSATREFEILLEEKNQQIQMLEHSLRVTSSEFRSGEEAGLYRAQHLERVLGEAKQELLENKQELLKTNSKIAELRDRLKRRDEKYVECKQYVKQLLSVVNMYESEFQNVERAIQI